MESSTSESSSSSNNVSPAVLTLKSSDGEIFEVETKVAVLCETLKAMVEDGCANDVIPLPIVESKALAMVIEWCRKRTTCKVSEKEKAEWDAKFVEIEDQEVLFDLILASNYLDVEPLFSKLCEKVARMIQGKSPEQIRGLFNITNDYTPEEEAEIRRENEWAFE